MFISITTYFEPKLVYQQIMAMYSKKNFYLIHYNKRCKLKKINELKRLFKNFSNIKIIRKYKVYWGEISILKSQLLCINEFLKTNHNFFIHLGAKEVNIRSIKYIEKICSNENINFMSFHSNYNIEQQLNRGCLFDFENKHSDIFYLRKWYKFFYRFKDIKILFLIILLWHFIINLFSRNFFKLIKSIFNFNEVCKILFYYMDDDNEVQRNRYLQFSKRKKKIPNELKNFKFILRKNVGPIILISRKDILKIVKQEKLIKKLYKFLRNCLAAEECFIASLYYNIIGNYKKSVNPLLQNSKDNELPYISKKEDNKYFMFARRVYGKENIDRITSELKKSKHF